MSEHQTNEETEPEKRQRTAEELKSSLFNAVKRGDFEKVKEIVNECPVENEEREKLLNSLSDGNCTLLHIAAENNQAAIINWLMSDKEGEGRFLGFNKVLARATDVQRTALHLAVERGRVEAFLAIVNGCEVANGERKAMLNAVAVEGWTVLHVAASLENLPIVSWLLSMEGGRAAGFDSVLGRTFSGETALHIAAWKGDLECCRMIVNRCRVDNGERQELINAVDNNGMTLLHTAVQHGRVKIITWILLDDGGRAAGFDRVLARTDNNSLTALHYAVRHPYNSNPTRALLSLCTSEERMNLFLAVDKNGWTALHEAARDYRMMPVISELLSYPECGLIVDRKDNLGMTVLHRAIIAGLDEESRREWGNYFVPNEKTIRILLGLDGNSSWPSTTTAKAWIDPNIGLGLL